MLRLYVDLAVQAAQRAVRSWLAVIALAVYAFVIALAAELVGPLGPLGGFIIALIMDACIASYLTALSVAVGGGKVRVVDFKVTGNAFMDVISVMFALWVISLGVRFLQGMAGSNGPAVLGVVGLATTIFFNVVPELIYSGRSRSFALLKESAEFVMESPFAWFAPNLLFAVALLGGLGLLHASSAGELVLNITAVLSPTGLLALASHRSLWFAAPLIAAFFHFVMVFRGLLFNELKSGSTRMRDFRRRMNNG